MLLEYFRLKEATEKLVTALENAIDQTGALFNVWERDGVLYVSNRDESEILIDLPETTNMSDLLETVMSKSMRQSFHEPESLTELDMKGWLPDGITPEVCLQYAEDMEAVHQDNHRLSDLAVAVYRHEIGGNKNVYKDLKQDWQNADAKEAEADISNVVKHTKELKLKPAEVVNSFLQEVEKKFRIKPEKMVAILKDVASERKHKEAVR